MKKKITICITIVVIMAILIAACNNNKDKSALTDTSQIDSSSADESTDINIEGSMDAADESTDASIEDSTDPADEEPSGEVATEAATKAEESGEALTDASIEKETDAREAATPAATTKAAPSITRAVQPQTQPATTKAATQPATTKAAQPTQPQTQAPKPTQPQTQAPKPTQPQTQAPKPTQPQTQAPTKAPVWHEPEYRTEQVWVVDKPAWTEEIKTPKQVPVYDLVGYIVCTCGFETRSVNEWLEHEDMHLDNEIPYAYKNEARKEIIGYKTEYDISYVEHPAEGHYETRQVLVKPGYWE